MSQSQSAGPAAFPARRGREGNAGAVRAAGARSRKATWAVGRRANGRGRSLTPEAPNPESQRLKQRVGSGKCECDFSAVLLCMRICDPGNLIKHGKRTFRRGGGAGGGGGNWQSGSPGLSMNPGPGRRVANCRIRGPSSRSSWPLCQLRLHWKWLSCDGDKRHANRGSALVHSVTVSSFSPLLGFVHFVSTADPTHGTSPVAAGCAGPRMVRVGNNDLILFSEHGKTSDGVTGT